MKAVKLEDTITQAKHYKSYVLNVVTHNQLFSPVLSVLEFELFGISSVEYSPEDIAVVHR